VKRARNFISAFFVALLMVFGLRTFLLERHCQFTPEGDAWREQQQLKFGKDPCDLDRQSSKGMVVIEIAVLVSGAAAIGTAGLVARSKYRDPSLRSG
jgi:hypothetical protein